LESLGERLNWASMHLQFCGEEEALGADSRRWIHRLSRQARWRRRGATTVEEWLLQYRSKRRTSIRREMKELARQGLTLDWVHGRDAPDRLFEQAADLYAATAARYGEKPRFGRRFFQALAEEPLRDLVLFVTASPEAGGDPVGIATKVVHEGVLYGRFWGAADRVRFLHFNVAIYGGIKYCLMQGLDRFDPGHGGEHKERRGLPAEPAHSLHRYVEPAAHRAFSDWAHRERSWMLDRIDESRAGSGLR
jgi:predicted N-acyltransferase